MAMIICGFPGVGKSCVATNRTNILDADSSGFSWKFDPEHPENKPERNPMFPSNYIEAIVKYSHNWEYILVSSHNEVRQMLKAKGIPYIIVAPRRELKNEYLIRYFQRYSTMKFIETLNEKWDEFLDSIEEDGAPIIWLDKGEYMSDVFGAIAR